MRNGSSSSSSSILLPGVAAPALAVAVPAAPLLTSLGGGGSGESGGLPGSPVGDALSVLLEDEVCPQGQVLGDERGRGGAARGGAGVRAELEGEKVGLFFFFFGGGGFWSRRSERI